MHNDKYYRSKIPLRLVLMFLANVIFMVALEILLVYKYPAVADEAVLGKYDPAWVGSPILSSDESSSLNAYLFEAPNGETRLLVVKRHCIFTGRGKILYNEAVACSEEAQTISVKNGIHISEIGIENGNTVTIRYGYSGGIKESTAWYLVLGAVLTALEMLIVYFIKRDP